MKDYRLPRPQGRGIGLLGLAAWLALMALNSGCSRQGAASASATESSHASSGSSDFVLPANPRGVTIVQVKSERLPDYLQIPARIQADPTRVVRVYAPVSGRLISVEVRPAERVSQGQTLATVASSDVAAARQAYQQAVADDTVKKQGLARSQALYEHHAIAQKDYEQAQADFQVSRAALESARERLELLNVGTDGSSDQLIVKSPRSGVVISLGAAAGEFSKSLDNSDPLCTIADLTTIWAVGDVYEKDLASVKVGEPAGVKVDAYPAQTWRGRIAAVASVMDPITRTLSVRVVLPNPGLQLKPDMFATIRLVRAVRPFVLAPSQAVLREGTSDYVFVQKSPGRFERRLVTLGQDTDGNQVEITSGLVAGDTIVVEGADLLRVAAAGS